MNIATELNAICRDIEMGVVDGYRIHSFLDFCLREKHQGRPSLYRSSRQSESVEQRKAGQSGRIQVPRSDLINDQLVVQLRRAASQAGRKDRDAAELAIEAGKRLRKLVDQYCEIHGEPIPEQTSEPEDWREYSTADAMDLLDINSRSTIRTHAKSSDHPYIEPGKRGRYKIDHSHPFVKGRLRE